MQKKHFIISLLILSVFGLGTSLYLVYNHYNPSLEGSVCDITASVSCTILNSGIYSKILGVPVAIYGVAWFIVLGILSWNSVRNKKNFQKLLLWNAGGFLSVFYFVYIEFLLSTFCPFCTVVHVLVAVSLILTIVGYRRL
ncbi:vitamin K epoxide reductase family protein [Candidatus Woesearchaeota archaeon]|nr:vitamin K epoxide reductase family protein [Candidatus Woesearchaeota archaeon]MBI2582123.1 vitamin K epoxide reductase family protein [Candidatus Woesearchaeota archaeon]